MILKDDPGSSDVHVDAPLGAKNKKPKNKLSNLLVKEVSFCPAGMNQSAEINLFKRFNGNMQITKENSSVGVGSMTLEQIQKELETALAKNKELEAKTAEQAAELEKAKAAADAKNKKVPPKDQADGGKDDPDADDMAKSMPESIVKMFNELKAQNETLAKKAEANEVELAKERAKREFAELAKRASTELPNLPGTDEVKGSVLKAVEALGEDALKVLKAADEAMGKNFEEIGTAQKVAKLDSEAALDKLAKEHAEAKKISFHKAYDEVLMTEAGRKLYAKMDEEKLAKK